MFAARLRNNFRYYLRSREVIDNFERLCELIISDKLRSCLPQGPLNYVLASEAGSWHSPDKVAELADCYVANHASVQNPKFVGAANISVSPRSPGKNRKPFAPQGQFRKWQGAGSYQNGNQGRSQRTDQQRCYCCNSLGHIARFCPDKRSNDTKVKVSLFHTHCTTSKQQHTLSNLMTEMHPTDLTNSAVTDLVSFIK